jgi:hypothetical protein
MKNRFRGITRPMGAIHENTWAASNMGQSGEFQSARGSQHDIPWGSQHGIWKLSFRRRIGGCVGNHTLVRARQISRSLPELSLSRTSVATQAPPKQDVHSLSVPTRRISRHPIHRKPWIDTSNRFLTVSSSWPESPTVSSETRRIVTRQKTTERGIGTIVFLRKTQTTC